MPETKVSRPESQSVSSLASKPRRRTGAASLAFRVSAEGRSWSMRQRPPRTTSSVSGTSTAAGRTSSCHAAAPRMANPAYFLPNPPSSAATGFCGRIASVFSVTVSALADLLT